jgi:hypothetical protein
MTSRVSNLELTKREERILPFLAIAIFYGAATYMFFVKLKLNPPLTTMMVLVTVLIVLLSIITVKFKISIHAAASWGVVGLLSALSLKLTGGMLLYPLIFVTLMAGAVSSARLKLGYHTPKEIWSGSLMGFMLNFMGLYLFY